MKKSIGFIGGGRVTRIILQSFRNKNAEFSSIAVTDNNSDVTARLINSFPEVKVVDAKEAASQDLVFISLHPPVIMDMLDMVKDNFKPGAVIISLAPKITTGKIASKAGNVKNLARLIPNATSYINEGYNPIAFSDSFDRNEKDELLRILKLMGKTFEVPEEKLESYAIMSAMLPTYFWFQWKELTDIGNKIGLTEKESRDAVNETLISSLNLMFKSGLTPAEVIDLIPVKPIGEHEAQINEIYRTKLPALFEKIKP